jgi:hypothetical protein
MKNAARVEPCQRGEHDMNMIRHYTPCIEAITLTVEVSQAVGNDLRSATVSEDTFAVMLIEETFESFGQRSIHHLFLRDCDAAAEA